MSTLIIGGGLSGLVTAQLIKQGLPEEELAVVQSGASNSSLAGNRFRNGGDNQPYDLVSMIEAIKSRGGEASPASIETFCNLGQIALKLFCEIPGIAEHNNNSWFGPKVTKEGHPANHPAPGPSLLNHLKKLLKNSGVAFERKELIRVSAAEGGTWDSYFSDGTKISSDRIVLANGSPTGRVFGDGSTNREIMKTAVELALTGNLIGLPEDSFEIAGGDLFMVHPFGKLNKKGKVVGCHPTDDLDGSNIYAGDKRLNGVEEALDNHSAHSNFTSITRNMWCSRESGAYAFQKNGKRISFKPAIHYWHVGLKPSGDYVKLAPGLYVAGEAGNTGRYFTGERLPGTALTMCLVDAYQIALDIANQNVSRPLNSTLLGRKDDVPEEDPSSVKALQSRNCKLVLASMMGDYSKYVDLACGASDGLAALSNFLLQEIYRKNH